LKPRAKRAKLFRLIGHMPEDAMLVAQIIRDKGDLVFTISPASTVAEAAALLNDRRVGALVVVEAGDRVTGILSERDLVRMLAKAGGEGLAQPVSAWMTQEVIFAEPHETVNSLLERMTDRRVRHLPVLKDGRLCGLISIGDLVKFKIAETEAEAEGLKSYIAAG
jgi:CBS domain-containing protein